MTKKKSETELGLLGDVPVGDRYDARHDTSDDGLDRYAYAKVLADSAIYTRVRTFGFLLAQE